MITKTLALNNIERKIFWIMSTALIAVFLFYLYSAFVITLAGVDRNNINRQTHELAVEAGLLEAEYLTEINKITFAYAKKLGFTEVSAKYTGNDSTKVSLAH